MSICALQSSGPVQNPVERYPLFLPGSCRLFDQVYTSCCVLLQERKHLAFTLKDTKTVVGKLENIIGFVIHALMIFFYLVIFDVRPLSLTDLVKYNYMTHKCIVVHIDIHCWLCYTHACQCVPTE